MTKPKSKSKTNKITLPADKLTQATNFLKGLGLPKEEVERLVRSVTRSYSISLKKKAQTKRIKAALRGLPIVKLSICKCSENCNENKIIGTDIKICANYARFILNKFKNIETTGVNIVLVIEELIKAQMFSVHWPPFAFVQYYNKLPSTKKNLLKKTFNLRLS